MISQKKLRQIRIPLSPIEYALVYSSEYICLSIAVLRTQMKNHFESHSFDLPANLSTDLPDYLSAIIFTYHINVVVSKNVLQSVLKKYLLTWTEKYENSCGRLNANLPIKPASNPKSLGKWQDGGTSRFSDSPFNLTLAQYLYNITSNRKFHDEGSFTKDNSRALLHKKTAIKYPGFEKTQLEENHPKVRRHALDSHYAEMHSMEVFTTSNRDTDDPNIENVHKKVKRYSVQSMGANHVVGSSDYSCSLQKCPQVSEHSMDSTCSQLHQQPSYNKQLNLVLFHGDKANKAENSREHAYSDITIDEKCLKAKQDCLRSIDQRVDSIMFLLFHSGLLTKIKENVLAFSLPQMGSLCSSIREGRKEILGKFKRNKYKEMLQIQLESKMLRRSKLSMNFHILDLIGKGFIEKETTASGPILRHCEEECDHSNSRRRVYR
ncbi:hypothetical protein IE077_003816 [Cardiosporidium cionae]|uniref:Uncharacterized protein n=1 Tax=Cardiosporidium cionae TaxID=476202 RepID=A0ABQ7J7E8_9APIC|nr:hypothetical protein IE077_003816 [Cardiosporidium cionae]|eukprot:KAF8819907.1 hypothetical protein IE077_003816 [Cardiosporidium cionae]